MTTASDSKDATAAIDAATQAAFSPASTTSSSYLPRQRTTILVHQKSPLLLATPPQITRVLAYSHPFLLPLNKAVGLLSWTTGDPWESFLLLAGFWGATLYGDVLIKWAGPLLVVVSLVLLIYARRFSPLSSSGWTTQQTRKRADSDSKSRHNKSLDEIVDTLRVFTSRCNVLLDPFIRLTDFLSTQSTATSATVRPSLTTLFLRILLLTPAWILLTLPPLHIITTRRFILTVGTFAISFHSRPARISRTILWRSRTVRRICAAITGLHFATAASETGSGSYADRRFSRAANSAAVALLAAKHGKAKGLARSKEGLRFTFVLYENQRRWLGIGWTSSMLAYERPAWTDEHLEPAVSKDKFALPEVEGGFAEWRWCEGSTWTVEGGGSEEQDVSTNNAHTKTSETTAGLVSGAQGKEAAKILKDVLEQGGWTYYDNKWHTPRQQDGWGRYTRRRKWCRDAELIEVDANADVAPSLPSRVKASSSATNTVQYVPSPTKATTGAVKDTAHITTATNSTDRKAKRAAANMDIASVSTNATLVPSDSVSGISTPVGSAKERRPWFGRRRTNSKASATDDEDHEQDKDKDARSGSGKTSGSYVFNLEEDNGYVPMTHRGRQGGLEADWGIGEDVGMDLG